MSETLEHPPVEKRAAAKPDAIEAPVEGAETASAARGNLVGAADLTDKNSSDLVRSLRPAAVSSEFPSIDLRMSGGERGPEPAGSDKQKPAPAEMEGPPRPGLPTPGITRDAQGRVTGVTYPDGDKREFGYDAKGNLNSVQQPNGDTFVLKNGRWQLDPERSREARRLNGSGGMSTSGSPFDRSMSSSSNSSSSEAPFRNPKVAADGTFTFDRIEGGKTQINPDGTSETKTKEGAVIKSDTKPDGIPRVASIQYPNGDRREFTYNNDGNLSTFTENGRLYGVMNDKVFGPDGTPTGQTRPRVYDDGRFSVRDKEGRTIVTDTDGSKVTTNRDLSVISQRPDGKVTSVEDPQHKVTNFSYDKEGNLRSVTDPTGKKFDAVVDAHGKVTDTFRARNGDLRKHLEVKPDGTVSYEDKQGKLHSDFVTGRSSVTSMTRDQITDAARLAHTETGRPDADNSGLRKATEKMTPADLVALDARHKELFGQSLTDVMKVQASDPTKRDASTAVLGRLAESQLRTTVAQQFSNPTEFERANKAITEFGERAKEQGMKPDEIIGAHLQAAEALRTHTDDKGKALSPKESVAQLEKTLLDRAPTIEHVSGRYGVASEEITRPDGTKARQFYVPGENGDKIPVLQTTETNPAKIDDQLRAWRDQKAREMETNYGVELSRDGDRERLLGKDVGLRAPRIDELLALDKGLQNSVPSAGPRTPPIKVQFPTEPTNPGADAYVLGGDRVVFEPMMGRTFRGMQDTVLHEWGHVGQFKMETANKAYYDKAAADMGFRRVTTASGAVQLQMRDKDGNYWAQNPANYEQPFGGAWTRVDDQGRTLKADGTLATGFNDLTAAIRSNNEMREAAAVRPGSTYFKNEKEMGAEALTYFRADGRSRAELLSMSPDMYRIAKEWDQKEIDMDPRFGTNPDGSSKFIRSPEGTIVPATQEERQRVAKYEEEVRKSPQAQSGLPEITFKNHVPGMPCPHCR